MIVLGIDPGLAKLGWAVMLVGDDHRRDVAFIDGGVLRTKPTHKRVRKAQGISVSEDKMRRALELSRALIKIATDYRPVVVCHEAVSLGFHQPITLFDMGIAFGVLAGIAQVDGVQLHSATPREIKLAMCKNPKAEKDHVIYAARQRFPDAKWPKATLLWEHEADAMGAVVVYAQRPVF